MDNDRPIPPASKSLAATLGGSSTSRVPTEHKAVEKAEGVGAQPHTPSAVIFKRGDIVLDTEKDVRVTILKPYVAISNLGANVHEIVNAKTGEKWLQWETNLKKK